MDILIKEIVNPKMKIYSPIGHKRFELVLYFFGGGVHYITYSPINPLKWMGAVRMRVQTADKNNIMNRGLTA